MTNLEYIRQLPGMEDAYPDIYGDAENPPTLCPHWAGLDNNAGGCNGCKGCYLADATIGGKPAPYLFHCPVKPGMTVYRLYRVCDRDDVVIEQRVCCRVGFTIYGMVIECDYWFVFYEDDWLVSVFPTREAAEKAVKEKK